jgi:O-antigen ligase
MRVARQTILKKVDQHSGIANWLFFGSAVITLYFNSKLQDPFNTPKLVILMLVAAWAFPHLLLGLRQERQSKTYLYLILLSLIFLISGFISAIFSNTKYISFIGETQRKNGYFSYLALVIIFLVAARFLSRNNIKRFQAIAFSTGLILCVYGLMQTSGLDFVQWNNPYNSIISTVGNPNFAAAIMAVIATLVFGPVLQSNFSTIFKTASLILVIAIIYTIYLSDARQGLISIIVGCGTYFLIWVTNRNRKIGTLLGSVGLVSFVLAILGMLQIGPLEKYLYKGSVTLRGYYWRTGIEMFKEHPWFGVGLDRYGSYFKDLRDVSYPLNYGFDITSTNAHNVPIQMFATGGLFFGLSYILILGTVASVGVKAILKSSGNDQLIIGSIFSAWMAFQAQSIVSIDNIGISVWGWLLSGLVIALAKEKNPNDPLKNSGAVRVTQKNNIKLLQPISSGMLVLLVLIPSTQLIKSESLMFQTRMRFNPSVPESKAQLKEYADKTISAGFVDPNYKVTAASYLVMTGFTNEGMSVLQELNTYDQRNLDTLLTLANFSSRLGKPEIAIKYRLEVAKYDKWNAANYLELGKLYKNTGDNVRMLKMLETIDSFAQDTTEGKQALIDLTVK